MESFKKLKTHITSNNGKDTNSTRYLQNVKEITPEVNKHPTVTSDYSINIS